MSFLLAEQNTMAALRHADYGYILENGRVVMDGDAGELSANEDVKEFYLGLSAGGPQELPGRQALPAPQAVAGVNERPCASEPVAAGIGRTYYDDLETRDPQEREAELFAKLPGQIARARRRAPALAKLLREIPSAEITSRAALARLPVLRKSELGELQKQAPPFGGLRGRRAGGGGPHLRLSRADLRAGRARSRFRGLRPRSLRGGVPAWGRRLQHLLLPLHAGRSHGGLGRARSGLRGLPRRGRPDRDPGGDDRRPAAGRLRRNPFVPEDSPREGRELGADHSSLRKALVSGEALPPALRAQFQEKGVRVFQCYTTADLGVIAYESEAMEG